MSNPTRDNHKTRPSISDVAKLANVSISTVSRVVNRSELVNLATRARVEDAIRRLGYQPNAFARGLMLRRSQIVGLVLPDMHGEYYSEIIRGANVQARESGYNLMVASTAASGDSQTVLGTLGRPGLLDGVAIMLSELIETPTELLAQLQRPFVVLDDDIPGLSHDCVVIDHHAGALGLVQHLLRQCGMRRLVFIGGPQTNVDTMARLNACKEAMQDARLEMHADDIHFLDYQYETAYARASQEVRGWARPHTCVFAANDEMAAGIVAAARTASIRVPQDLGVVGFDDTRIARMTQPALTTVRVPMAEMGAKAIELLCQRLAEPDRTPTRVSLTPQLVTRDSCGAHRSGVATMRRERGAG